MDDLTILNEVHKGITMGMASLEVISDKSQDEDFKSDLSYQYNEYQHSLNDVNSKFKESGEIPDDIPMNTKLMGWTGIQFNTLKDTSTSKLSEILIQGYDMGVIKGVKLLNENPDASEPVKNILNGFVSLQENCINRLKRFL